MKKRITALLLAAIMVICMAVMAGCKNDPDKPSSGTGDPGKTPSDTQGSSDSTPADTETPDTKPADDSQTNQYGVPAEFFENYIPDPDAVYMGKAGYMLKGGAVIDEIRLVRGSRTVMYENKFEESKEIIDGLFTTFGGAVSEWSVNDNNALTYTGSADSVLTIGNTQWGGYKSISKLTLAEGSEARLYFCVKDESNGYYVSVTPEGSSLHQISGGSDTTVIEFALPNPVDAALNVTADVDAKSITVYIDGIDLFYISEDQTPHTYSGMFGISQWGVEFYIDNIMVEDIYTGEVLFSEDFENGTGFIDNARFGNRNGGNWNAANTDDWEIIELDDGNHVLHYKVSSSEGSTILFDGNIGDGTSAYRFTYDGYRIAGGEGYPCVWDCDPDSVDEKGYLADYYCYCHGGWSGKSAIQVLINGEKTNYQNSINIGIMTGQWQKVETQLYSNCILNLFHDEFVQVYWH